MLQIKLNHWSRNDVHFFYFIMCKCRPATNISNSKSNCLWSAPSLIHGLAIDSSSIFKYARQMKRRSKQMSKVFSYQRLISYTRNEIMFQYECSDSRSAFRSLYIWSAKKGNAIIAMVVLCHRFCLFCKLSMDSVAAIGCRMTERL